MKRPARDSNRRPQRLEVRTLTTTPPRPLVSGGRQVLTLHHPGPSFQLLIVSVIVAHDPVEERQINNEYKDSFKGWKHCPYDWLLAVSNLMQVFHWSRPYDSRVGYKNNQGSGTKIHKNGQEITMSVAPPRQDGTLTDRMW